MIPESVWPVRIKRLKRNEGGYPVPWFVGYVDGKPDFRMIAPEKIVEAINYRLCWICGEPLGAYKAFVIGPMCAVNRIDSEPPAHRDCAIFAAINCPFLADPERKRREGNKPEGHRPPAGIHLDRNPGVAVVWITRRFQPFQVENGVLFKIGDPEEMLWYARGRRATHAEILESLDSGMPELYKAAEQEGPESIEDLKKRHHRVIEMVQKIGV